MRHIQADRRSRVMAALGGDGALVVGASPELRAGDTELRYVPGADLYWLTGCTEPEAVLVLCPSADEPFTLFVRPRDPGKERWTGVRGGVEAAREMFGADAVHPVAELAQRLPKLLANASTLYAPVASMTALSTAATAARADIESAIRLVLDDALHARPRRGRGVRTITDVQAILAPMRVVKDAHEIDAIRRAADITVLAFEEAARGIRDASHEYVVEAAIEFAFRNRGAMGPAFPTIAAGGANATVLHYITNDSPLRDGELLLIDAGARADMYCADITRTFPVNGRFSPAQRDVYDIVLAAHDAVIERAVTGRTTSDLDDAALRTLTQGMVDLGLLSGSVDTLIEERAYRKWFPHRVSHWLGLDVHDAGDYMIEDSPVELVDGMVLTVEPGLYIPADATDAPAHLRGIGIRLEDDVLVAAGGPDVLTAALAIRPGDVEALLGG